MRLVDRQHNPNQTDLSLKKAIPYKKTQFPDKEQEARVLALSQYLPTLDEKAVQVAFASALAKGTTTSIANFTAVRNRTPNQISNKARGLLSY